MQLRELTLLCLWLHRYNGSLPYLELVAITIHNYCINTVIPVLSSTYAGVVVNGIGVAGKTVYWLLIVND